MVPEPVQEQVMQAKCPAADYNRVPVPPGVPNDHQGSETLVMLLHEISSCQKRSGSHHFQFYFSSSFLHRPRSQVDALHGTAVLLSRIWLWHAWRRVGKIKRSLTTHLRFRYHWRQRGSGGRGDVKVRLLNHWVSTPVSSPSALSS